MNNYKKFKKEISGEFSDVEEIDGILCSVEFNATFSHDRVIKKQVDECILPSELHRKTKPKRKIDNRFLSKRMRDIMFLPIKRKE